MSRADDKIENVVLRILDTATALEHRMDVELAHTRGISFREYRLLKTLADSANNRLTRVALAQAVSVSPSGVTRALKPLEKLGYVSTVKNERDARQSLACVTDAGYELVADAKRVLDDFFNELDVQCVDQDQLETLEQMLASMGKR